MLSMLRMGVLLLWLPALAVADEIQSLLSIEAAVRGFLEEQAQQYEDVEISVSPLDPRLRLAPCEQPLEAYFPPGGRTTGSTLVGVRCRGEHPWSLYVSATVAVQELVVVTARPVSRGLPLSAGDVVLERRDLSRVTSGFLTDPAAAIGKSVTRGLGQGIILSPNMLKAALLVRRGERVTLTAKTGGLEVRMQGEALADGVEGQRIRVRNLSSKREVEGVVVAPGVIEVPM